MRPDIEPHVQFSLMRNGFELYFRCGEAIAQPVEFAPVEPGVAAQPALTLRHDEAQWLMDSLWRAGLRPTAGKQSEGQFAATAKHLEDMRALAFAKLNVAAPA